MAKIFLVSLLAISVFACTSALRPSEEGVPTKVQDAPSAYSKNEAPTKVQDPANAYFQSGVDYLNKGEYDQAIEEFNKVLKINPRNAEAYYYRGNARLFSAQEEEDIFGPFEDLFILFGLPSLYDQAIEDYTKSLEINPKNADAFLNRGNAYYDKGKYDQAMADYNKVLEVNPRNADALVGRGNIYYSKIQYDQAISDYTKAIEIYPKYTEASYNRGLAYHAKGQYDQAISDYAKALEVDPGYADAYLSRGDAYKIKGMYDEAISDYTKFLVMNPEDVKACHNRGDAYYFKGRYNEAVADYTKALEINPKDARACNILGWIYATVEAPELRNGKKAVELSIKACELSDWKNPEYLDTLAAAYARVGDFSNAIKWQEKALESFAASQKAEAQQRLNFYKDHKPWSMDMTKIK